MMRNNFNIEEFISLFDEIDWDSLEIGMTELKSLLYSVKKTQKRTLLYDNWDFGMLCADKYVVSVYFLVKMGRN